MFVVITHNMGQKNESSKGCQRFEEEKYKTKKSPQKPNICVTLMSCCCGTDLGSFISRSLLHVEIFLSIITQGSAADHSSGLRVGGRTTDCFSRAFGLIALPNCLIFPRVDLLLDILFKTRELSE